MVSKSVPHDTGCIQHTVVSSIGRPLAIPLSQNHLYHASSGSHRLETKKVTQPATIARTAHMESAYINMKRPPAISISTQAQARRIHMQVLHAATFCALSQRTGFMVVRAYTSTDAF